MRKTLKKAMSVVLSAALVLSLGNVGFSKEASAADGDVYAQWDGEWVPTIWTDSEVPGSNTGEFTTLSDGANMFVDPSSWNAGFYNLDLSVMTLTVTYSSSDGTKLSEISGLIQTNVTGDAWTVVEPANTPTDDGSVYSLVLTDADLTDGNLYICPNVAGITVTQIKLIEGEASTDDAASSDTYLATLSYCEAGWGPVQDWGESESARTQVALELGSATYSLSLTFDGESEGAEVFVVDIEGFDAAAKEAGYAIELTDLAVTIGDEALDVDLEKVDTGDIEEKGNYRIEIYNPGGGGITGKDSPIDASKLVTPNTITVDFTLNIVEAPASDDDEDAAEDEEDETVALNEYHAYLGFQTGPYNYRDQWAKSESTEASVDGYDFDTMAVFNGAATDPSQVVIENATITENGEYTVSMTGLDLSEDQYFRMLYVSTDIPSTMSGVEVTDAVITLDDTTYEMAVLPVKNDIRNGKTDDAFAGYMFMAIDQYDKDNEDLCVINTDWDNEVPENYTMPQNTVSISFKISGVDFAFSDNAGAKKTVNGVTYKVTKNGNAKVVKVKNQKKVTIKNKVKINGTSYKVTSLKKGVFSGKSKVANVTLGKNIKKIPAKAFKKCTNLKKLTVNAKLTSVKKNAFKGCKKTIKVSGKKVAANVKTLKASGYKKFTK